MHHESATRTQRLKCGDLSPCTDKFWKFDVDFKLWHNNNIIIIRDMPRPKNKIKTEQITISTNAVLCGDLDRVVLTGYYGNSRAEAAERLITEGIRHLIRERCNIEESKGDQIMKSAPEWKAHLALSLRSGVNVSKSF